VSGRTERFHWCPRHPIDPSIHLIDPSSIDFPAVPDIDQRDPDEVASQLTRWLSTKSDQGLEVFDVQAPASNGFSNETILCRTRSSVEERRLVVRVAPTKHLLFMDAQFSTQYRVMKALADGHSVVPLPTLGWYEEDPQYLGVPFFTMDHVEGNVPPDNIPYTMEGWVIEASPEQQERMWWSGIDALAAVHRTDWRSLGLDWLSDEKRGRPGIEQQMSYYRDYLDWATKGVEVPVIESTWQWLVDHQPAEDGEIVLSWGDSRIGNIIWDDFRCAAVLDWEMASLGQPEMDLGWYLYFDRQFTEPLGVPRPAGFGSHEETIERYGELLGRPMKDLFFYEVFSGFRFAVIMSRLSDLVFGRNVIDEAPDMATNNLATQLLASMLDLDPPG
jgi:aminoglycoside phosphotransferase (APT) family kinase protein